MIIRMLRYLVMAGIVAAAIPCNAATCEEGFRATDRAIHGLA